MLGWLAEGAMQPVLLYARRRRLRFISPPVQSASDDNRSV